MDIVIIETLKKGESENVSGCFICKTKAYAEEIFDYIDQSELSKASGLVFAIADGEVIERNPKSEFTTFTLSGEEYSAFIDEGKIKLK